MGLAMLVSPVWIVSNSKQDVVFLMTGNLSDEVTISDLHWQMVVVLVWSPNAPSELKLVELFQSNAFGVSQSIID